MPVSASARLAAASCCCTKPAAPVCGTAVATGWALSGAGVLLADFVTGIPVTELCAELTTFVEGRRLDDDAQILLRYANGARGMLWASQVSPGNENGLQLRVYGTMGGIHWRQESPNHLYHTPFGEPTRILTRGGAGGGVGWWRLGG
jgi:predicted dehydrogenase